MRILFMGTPDFAVASLRQLVADGHEICGVFSQPDKPKNRGHKLVPTPVKEYALTQNIPVYQPEKLRDGTALELVRSLAPELTVVAAYGRILPEDILEAGRSFYHELSGETAEFIDHMLENGMMDVLSRPGKAGGGYCTTLTAYKTPYIFANFNGTSGDVEVITHEAGHAFASWTSRDIVTAESSSHSLEGCEVHSMSMEFFAEPWAERFFGADADKFRWQHLADAVTFIPYGTLVDHFQHECYEHPECTPEQRNAAWSRLAAVYMPWLKPE